MERPVPEVKRPCDNRDSVQLRCRTRVSHASRALLRGALRVARHERDRPMIYLLGGSGYNEAIIRVLENWESSLVPA